AEDGIRDWSVTGVQTCALPIFTLAGTLTLPKGASAKQPVSAIVTITGSGAQARDENIGLPGFRPFRQLADALGRRGIAVLRMDEIGRASCRERGEMSVGACSC